MNRRGFLAGILAAGAAPVIVRASSLMPIYVPKPARFVLPAGYVGVFHEHRTVHKIATGDGGWLPLDGRIITRAQYPALFAVFSHLQQLQATKGEVTLCDMRGHVL